MRAPRDRIRATHEPDSGSDPSFRIWFVPRERAGLQEVSHVVERWNRRRARAYSSQSLALPLLEITDPRALVAEHLYFYRLVA
jgi:hypothetical protein